MLRIMVTAKKLSSIVRRKFLPTHLLQRRVLSFSIVLTLMMTYGITPKLTSQVLTTKENFEVILTYSMEMARY